MDFDEAERLLRAEAKRYAVWRCEGFLALPGRHCSKSVSGEHGATYQFVLDVLDRSNDYEPGQVLLEIEFSVAEARKARLWAQLASVRAVTFLEGGQAFSGELEDLRRSPARSQVVPLLVTTAIVAGIGTGLGWCCS